MKFNIKPQSKQPYELSNPFSNLFPSYFDLLKEGRDRTEYFGKIDINFTEQGYNSAVKMLDTLINQSDHFLADLSNENEKLEKTKELIVNIATAIYHFQKQGINLLINQEQAETIVYNALLTVSSNATDMNYFSLSKFYLKFYFEHDNQELANNLCELIKFTIFEMKFQTNTKNVVGNIDEHIKYLDESFGILPVSDLILKLGRLYNEEKTLLEFYKKIEELKQQFPKKMELYTINELFEKGITSKTGYLLEEFIVNNRDNMTLFILNNLLKNKEELNYGVYKIFIPLTSIYSSDYLNSIKKHIFSEEDLTNISKFRFKSLTDFYSLSQIIVKITENIENNINTNETLTSSFEFVIKEIQTLVPKEAITGVHRDFGFNTSKRWEHIMKNMPEEGKIFLRSQNINPPIEVSLLNEENLPKFSMLLEKTKNFLENKGYYSYDENYKNYFSTALAFFMLEESLHNLQGGKDVFRSKLNGVSTNEQILETILGFQKTEYETGKQDISVKDILAIYYYNRKNLNQNIDVHSHNLFISFYGMLAVKVGINLGEYVPLFNDCYDALVKLEIFWWYGFQVNNKEEMQATFNYISSSQWDIETRKRRLGGKNKEVFIKVLERTLDTLSSKRLEGESPSVEEWRVFSIYGILKTDEDLNIISKKLSSKDPSINLDKISYKIKKNLGLETSSGKFILNANYSTKEGKIFIRNTEAYKGVVWFKYVNSIESQIPLHFVSGIVPKKITKNLGENVDNILGDIKVGDYIEEVLSHWGTGNKHNLLIAYNETGELSTIEFHSGSTLNSLKVNIELYKMIINEHIIKQSNVRLRASGLKSNGKLFNQNISAETLMGVTY